MNSWLNSLVSGAHIRALRCEVLLSIWQPNFAGSTLLTHVGHPLRIASSGISSL